MIRNILIMLRGYENYFFLSVYIFFCERRGLADSGWKSEFFSYKEYWLFID